MNFMYEISAAILQFIAWLVLFPILRVIFSLKVTGIKNLRGLTPGLLIASNHTGELDAILIRNIFSFFSFLTPIFYVSMQKENYKNFGWKYFFYGGLFFKLLGAYPSHSGHKNYSFALQDHIRLLNNKKTVCIFPEGKRADHFTQDNPRGGAAFLSLQCNVPVLPIAIKGLYNSGPLKKSFRKKIEIAIGKPILPNQLRIVTNEKLVNPYKKGSAIIMGRIAELL